MLGGGARGSQVCPFIAGYQHNDWLIETPRIDLDAPIDFNPVILRETLNFFLQSGERLTQMTRVYDDSEALTKLLEEVHFTLSKCKALDNNMIFVI